MLNFGHGAILLKAAWLKLLFWINSRVTCYRDQAQAFAQDALALALAQEAISLDLDQALSPEQRSFLYMPFMHSESKLIHEFALKLFQALR